MKFRSRITPELLDRFSRNKRHNDRLSSRYLRNVFEELGPCDAFRDSIIFEGHTNSEVGNRYSYEIFELLLCHYCPRPLSSAFYPYSSPFKWPAQVKTTLLHMRICTIQHVVSTLFSSSRCRNSTKNVKYENPGISGDRPYRFLNVGLNFVDRFGDLEIAY